MSSLSILISFLFAQELIYFLHSVSFTIKTTQLHTMNNVNNINNLTSPIPQNFLHYNFSYNLHFMSLL